MTLAETASIMCETIVTEAVLAEHQGPAGGTGRAGGADPGRRPRWSWTSTRATCSRRKSSSAASRPSSRPTTSARSWSAPRRPPTATAWTSATCRSSCGPGSRTTTRRACRSTTSRMPSGLLFATGLYAIYQQRGRSLRARLQEAAGLHRRGRRGRPCQALRHRHPHTQVLGRQPGHHRQAHRSLLRDLERPGTGNGMRIYAIDHVQLAMPAGQEDRAHAILCTGAGLH